MSLLGSRHVFSAFSGRTGRLDSSLILAFLRVLADSHGRAVPTRMRRHFHVSGSRRGGTSYPPQPLPRLRPIPSPHPPPSSRAPPPPPEPLRRLGPIRSPDRSYSSRAAPPEPN